MWQIIYFSLICTLNFFSSNSAAEDKKRETFTIMVEDAAFPWSKNDGTGYANDVVIAAFKAMAVDVHLKVVPYARCKYTVLSGRVVACFSMSWSPEFEGRIKLASLPIYTVSNSIYENINTPLPRPTDGFCDLPSGTIIGISRDYEYSAQATALKEKGVVFESSRSDLLSLRKLASMRVSAALITSNYSTKKIHNTEPNDTENVQFAFNCGTTTATIGFSLAHPDGRRALDIYDMGFQRLNSSGALTKIRKRWFP